MIGVSHPKKPTFAELEKNTGKIIIDGCHPGYGTTLGNTLRRVLLSSLPGAAVTSVKISSVSHEFSTLPGVQEDIIQIILNLKKVRFKIHKDEPVKLTLKEKGVKKITAARIQCPADVEVVNKDAYIAQISDKKAEIEMEIEVQKGLGYVPVEQQEREKKEIGLIAIDAIFTPVRRVNYTVENTRVGKRTDYDKITLEIETDGTITPEEAYEQATSIIIEQFTSMAGLEKKKPEVAAKKELAKDIESKGAMGGTEEEKVQKPVGVDVMETSVETLAFSTRTSNVLEKNNIRTAKDLAVLTEEELLGYEGMGDKGIKEIKKALGNLGLNLKGLENYGNESY